MKMNCRWCGRDIDGQPYIIKTWLNGADHEYYYCQSCGPKVGV